MANRIVGKHRENLIAIYGDQQITTTHNNGHFQKSLKVEDQPLPLQVQQRDQHLESNKRKCCCNVLRIQLHLITSIKQ